MGATNDLKRRLRTLKRRLRTLELRHSRGDGLLQQALAPKIAGLKTELAAAELEDKRAAEAAAEAAAVEAEPGPSVDMETVIPDGDQDSEDEPDEEDNLLAITKMNAKDAIELIGTMDTKQVDAAWAEESAEDGKQRKTVLEALEAREDELGEE